MSGFSPSELLVQMSCGFSSSELIWLYTYLSYRYLELYMYISYSYKFPIFIRYIVFYANVRYTIWLFSYVCIGMSILLPSCLYCIRYYCMLNVRYTILPLSYVFTGILLWSDMYLYMYLSYTKCSLVYWFDLICTLYVHIIY